MDVNAANPYEQKLYNMFKSFDTQSLGTLDKNALLDLCTTLELKDRSAKLVANLIDPKRNNRVTFNEFKEGLLNLLGTSDDNDDSITNASNGSASSGGKHSSPTQHSSHHEHHRHHQQQQHHHELNDSSSMAQSMNEDDGTTSATASKSREVSPKLVVRGKKYGRRSRPQSVAAFESSQSDSEEDYDFARVPTAAADNKSPKTYHKVQRSVSQGDMHDANGRRIRSSNVVAAAAACSATNNGTKLKRCASLPAQKQRSVPYMSSKETENLKLQLESSVESLDHLDFEHLSNSLFHEWNNFDSNAIIDDADDRHGKDGNGGGNACDDTKIRVTTTTTTTVSAAAANVHRNRIELETIFRRVGLQEPVAIRLADEVYNKLGLTDDQSISFTNFLTLIHSVHSDAVDSVGKAAANNCNIAGVPTMATAANTTSATTTDEYTCSRSLNEHMIFDMHASSDEPHDWSNESLSADTIIDMWELNHVKNPAVLMEDLGFNDREINLSRLLGVIDEELQNVHNDREFTPLLRASLTLHKLEVNALQKSLRHAAYENKQLHINVRELNHRSFILAQEVDERHATLESSAREQVKQLEQRHAEIVRELTAQLSNEREQWSVLNAKLEKRIKQFESDDAKHKVNLIRLQSENSALEKEQLSLQSQITDLLEKNIALNNEIADAEDRQYQNGGGGADGISLDDRDFNAADQQLELIDKIARLQIENANLRDRNDELGIELEETLTELNRMKNRKQQLRIDSSNHSGGEDNASSGGEGSNVSSNGSATGAAAAAAAATKRRGDSPSKAKLSEESPRFGKLRKYHNDNSEGESEASGDWLALNSELNQSASQMSQTTTVTTSGFSQDFSSLTEPKDIEIKELRQQIKKLEYELSAMKTQQQQQSVVSASEKSSNSINVDNTANDGTTPSASASTTKTDGDAKVHLQRIQELENSLEQMQKEYEACEDYWQGKLNEERQLYEEEQRISDEKFTELLKKMAEYEEQFTTSTSATVAEDEKDGRLTPIEEKCQLEQQYADLEAETEEFREHARKIFEAKAQEIDQLQAKIKEFESRLCYPNGEQLLNMSAQQQQQQQSRLKTSDSESVASSPISYLWNQSTIQVPTRDYQNPNWNRTATGAATSATAAALAAAANEECNQLLIDETPPQNTIAPIQRPHTPSTSASTTLKNTCIESNEHDNAIDNTTEILDDVLSIRSFGTHSIASTHSIHRSLPEIISTSPNMIRDDIKRLKLIELQLNDEVKNLAHQRDGLAMELQQLQEAKPVLERAYARTPHPSLIQRIQQLEQKNRQLQFCLKQQQQYTESIMQQSWQQQRTEINELRNTVETQVIIINEQAQRLTNSDLLVKDLYVENSQLTAAIQRLEQQRSRSNMMLQHQGVPGML